MLCFVLVAYEGWASMCCPQLGSKGIIYSLALMLLFFHVQILFFCAFSLIVSVVPLSILLTTLLHTAPHTNNLKEYLVSRSGMKRQDAGRSSSQSASDPGSQESFLKEIYSFIDLRKVKIF